MSFSALIVFPSVEREPDVLLLALFCSAAKKNDNLLAVFPEIHAVTRAEMDFAFKNASANAFDVREVSQSYAI